MDFEDFDDDIIDYEVEEDNGDEIDILSKNKNIKLEKKITLPVMFRYEKSDIISKRIKLLDKKYKTTIPEIIKKEGIVKSFDIAMKEFELGKLPPYIIYRDLENGNYEEWKHEDFKYFP